MFKVDVHELIGALTQLQMTANGNEIKKKELQLTFNKFPALNKHGLKLVLTKNFFFADDGREYYDFTKVQFYNLLYCNGDP